MKTHTMRADIKARWLKALRSGEYTQAKGTLKNDVGGFCCLGVLTDLAVKDGVGKWIDVRYHAVNGFSYEASSDLHAATRDWAGLKGLFVYGVDTSHYRRNPIINTAGDNVESWLTLAELNDSGKTFGEIADLIDACIEGVPA